MMNADCAQFLVAGDTIRQVHAARTCQHENVF
jgi:hypothetical protein